MSMTSSASASTSAVTSALRTITTLSPLCAPFLVRARCWMGADVTGGERQLPARHDALSLQADYLGVGQTTQKQQVPPRSSGTSKYRTPPASSALTGPSITAATVCDSSFSVARLVAGS